MNWMVATDLILLDPLILAVIIRISISTKKQLVSSFKKILETKAPKKVPQQK